MIQDILTVVWKESRELIAMQGTLKGGLLRYAITFGILGVYLPYSFGRDFLEVPVFGLIYVWFSMFMGVGVVLDSFAGERERHTLETLLASRLSDTAILFGKILAAVIYGFSLTMVLMALGLTVVNIAYWNGQITLYPADITAFVVLAAMLVSLFFASVGVLVSLRAPTVRQGSEMLMVALIGIAAVPFVLFFLLPDAWKKSLLDVVVSAGVTSLAVGALAVLVVLCLVTLYAAILSFRRDKLILD